MSNAKKKTIIGIFEDSKCFHVCLCQTQEQKVVATPNRFLFQSKICLSLWSLQLVNNAGLKWLLIPRKKKHFKFYLILDYFLLLPSHRTRSSAPEIHTRLLNKYIFLQVPHWLVAYTENIFKGWPKENKFSDRRASDYTSLHFTSLPSLHSLCSSFFNNTLTFFNDSLDALNIRVNF